MPNTQSSFCDIMWVEVPYAVLHILESKWLIAVSAVLYCHIISLSHLPFSPTSIFYLVNTASCQEMSAYTWKHWSGWKGCSISDRPVGGAVMLLQITEENGEQDMEHAHKVKEDRRRDPTSHLPIAERLLYHVFVHTKGRSDKRFPHFRLIPFPSGRALSHIRSVNNYNISCPRIWETLQSSCCDHL